MYPCEKSLDVTAMCHTYRFSVPYTINLFLFFMHEMVFPC